MANKLTLNLNDTQTAFKSKSDRELKKTAWLFRLMSNATLTKILSSLGVWAAKMRLPISTRIIKNTIYEQFCGGTTLLDCQKTIDKLNSYNVLSVLDYGAEGNESEHSFDATMNEFLRAAEFASLHDSVPVISMKITGLARFGLLEKISSGNPLNESETKEYE
ncbi:MAG TPA: proline dehydrogenase, partial [Saprospiraceae bacterium]|nr:proline dehydrogenase [Saprospiraceae bacterium]